MDEQEEPNKENKPNNTDKPSPANPARKKITPRRDYLAASKQSCDWHGISIDGVTETQTNYKEILKKWLPDRCALARKGIDYHLSQILYNVAKDADSFFSIDPATKDWLQHNAENYQQCAYPPLDLKDKDSDRPIIQHAWMLVSLLEGDHVENHQLLVESAEGIERLLRMDDQLAESEKKIKELTPKMPIFDNHVWQDMRTAIYTLSHTLNTVMNLQDETGYNHGLGNTMILEEDRTNKEDETQQILRLTRENWDILQEDFSSLLGWMARTKRDISPSTPSGPQP